MRGALCSAIVYSFRKLASWLDSRPVCMVDVLAADTNHLAGPMDEIKGYEDRVFTEGYVLCVFCKGDGTQECGECNGSGTQTHECDRGYDHEESCSCENGEEECWECGGAGEVMDPDREVDEGL